MDYKAIVEEKFGKPLKEVMYEICVEKRMEKWDGAEVLGVPLKTFVAWRSKYRFGPMQIQADWSERKRIETIQKYNEELNEINLARKLEHEGNNSIEAYKELIERMLELEKHNRTLQETDTMSDISMMLKIGMLESTLESIEQFESGQLYNDFKTKLQFL